MSSPKIPLSRRHFITSTATTGAGLLFLPSGTLFGANRPGNKLNIALIGTSGRARAHYNGLASENVVALCDVDVNNLAKGQAKFPGAKTYSDWRKCLEQKDLDAVLCCTPDHHHALIAIAAMNRGLHVYMEKPIALTVEESRLVRATYLKNKHKLATQAGTQRHANPNFARVRELIRDGAVGELRNVYAWGNRQLPKPGYYPAAGAPPAFLNWDLWLGPSREHPFNPGYFENFKQKPNGNCLQWNMFWDFGTGQVGDMGAHTMDLAWNAIDAGLPTAIEAKGDPFNPDVTPVKMEAHFEHPANDWRPAITVSWFQGGAMPNSPRPFLDLNKVDHGVMFKGTKGHLIADFTSRTVLPFGDTADMTYYKPRAKEALSPEIGDFQLEWINACKGNLKTCCNFDYNGTMTEQMALGLVAYRAGKKLQYDGASGRITNDAAANAHLRREYRSGWGLNTVTTIAANV
jgi:predicted dehydrogenase